MFLSISDYEPQSICEHLQYLFALLQNSNRKYIDPSGLVKALGLDTGQQQVNHYMKFLDYVVEVHNCFHSLKKTMLLKTMFMFYTKPYCED